LRERDFFNECFFNEWRKTMNVYLVYGYRKDDEEGFAEHFSARSWQKAEALAKKGGRVVTGGWKLSKKEKKGRLS